MNRIQKFVLNHVVWMDWLLPAIMTLSATFLSYDPSKLKDGSHWRYTVEFIIPCLGWVLGASVLIYILVKIIEATGKPKLNKIQNELNQAEYRNKLISEQVRNLFDGYLYNLANKLSFGKLSENNERISLYIHDNNNTFIPCGRYSANPKYRSPSRTSYPDNEGCISKGWEHDWHFDDQFPCPENQRGKYIDYCLNKYGIPRNTCRDINMKSRSFAALSIKNNGNSFAVLVLESTKADRFSEDEVKSILKEQNDFLAETIRQLRDFIPKPSNASIRGL